MERTAELKAEGAFATMINSGLETPFFLSAVTDSPAGQRASHQALGEASRRETSGTVCTAQHILATQKQWDGTGCFTAVSI